MREINAVDYLRQSEAGAKLMMDFEAYAKELGCRIEGDSIIANREQAEKLQDWWRERK